MAAYRTKAWEDLTIADDYMFKLVMKHERFCKRLIEKILKIKIRHIDYLDDEKSLKFRYAGKGVRLDVYIEDDANTVYDIEMQVRDYGDKELTHRTRYYQSMIDVDALTAGSDYKELKNSFVIFLCPFGLFDGKRHLYTFRNVCIEDKELELMDGTSKVFLCSEGQLDDVSTDVKAFLDYMKGLPSADDFVNEIDGFIKEIKVKEEERVSYMTYEMKMREAHDDGMDERSVQVAIDMLNDNEPMEKILKYSRLPKERIEELSKEIKG
jgi:predicted transposase/invertase (TIGR01784 family)